MAETPDPVGGVSWNYISGSCKGILCQLYVSLFWNMISGMCKIPAELTSLDFKLWYMHQLTAMSLCHWIAKTPFAGKL